MKFEYTGRHIEVTPALRSHVEQQFKRINHLVDGNSTKAHVVIEVERGRHRSEIIVNWRNETLTATSRLSDMYQSLSQSVAKIEKQALRLKNKVIDKSHRAQKTGAIVPPTADVAPAPSAPRIIKSRRYPIKPMAEDEAALLLSTDENNFLVFRNAETEKIAVIFKRKDRNYGLIEP